MPWFDKECLSTKNNIRHLENKLKENPGDRRIRTELFTQKKKLQKLVRNKKRQYKQSIINKMSNINNKDEKQFWKLVKKLEQNNTRNTQYVSHGNLFNHFKSILNSRNVNIPPDNLEKGKLDYHFTIEEHKKAYSILKSGKATGIDNLSNEMIACFTEIYPLLTIKLFNSILDSNKVIPDWTIGNDYINLQKRFQNQPSQLQRNIPIIMLWKTLYDLFKQ